MCERVATCAWNGCGSPGVSPDLGHAAVGAQASELRPLLALLHRHGRFPRELGDHVDLVLRGGRGRFCRRVRQAHPAVLSGLLLVGRRVGDGVVRLRHAGDGDDDDGEHHDAEQTGGGDERMRGLRLGHSAGLLVPTGVSVLVPYFFLKEDTSLSTFFKVNYS